MLISTLGACSSLSIELPPEFLQLETGRGEVKATTPDDGLLWLRQFDDRDQGDLEFWAESMKLDLVDNRGYVQVGDEQLLDALGQEVMQMQFRLTTAGEPHGYLVCLFVFEGYWSNTILVAEFVAPERVFQGHLDAVKAAMLTIDR